MNFLAHLHLAHDTPESLIGNAIADFVKWPAFDALPLPIQLGVRQHRAVDAFTDSHAKVQRSITRISKNWGWFSGIIIDVYYDHILAQHWDRYSAEPRRTFTDRMHLVIRSCIPHVEAKHIPFFTNFDNYDQLFAYGSRAGIELTLLRLSKRIEERMPKRAVKLQDAMPELIEKHAELCEDFHEFYPELMAFAKAWG